MSRDWNVKLQPEGTSWLATLTDDDGLEVTNAVGDSIADALSALSEQLGNVVDDVADAIKSIICADGEKAP